MTPPNKPNDIEARITTGDGFVCSKCGEQDHKSDQHECAIKPSNKPRGPTTVEEWADSIPEQVRKQRIEWGDNPTGGSVTCWSSDPKWKTERTFTIETIRRAQEQSRQEIKIGELTISTQLGPGKFWIYKQDGEGMETSERALEKCLLEFYEREF